MPPAGTLPVIPTPFLNGQVDYPSLGRLLDFICTDCDGFTVMGSTGEGPSMSLGERMAVAEYAVRRAPAGKQVVVGIGHPNAQEAMGLAKHAEHIGAAAVLVPAPFYFANTQQGVYEFLRCIDREIRIDLVFYDNPYSTKTFFTAQDLATLASRLEHLTAIKVTDHQIDKIAWLKAHTSLAVFSGEDALIFRSLLLGCDGCMIIAPAVLPTAYAEAMKLLRAGAVAEALSHFSRRILPFIHMFGLGNEIAATKALYQQLGLFTSDELRPPLQRVDDAFRAHLILAYAECNKGGESDGSKS